MPSDFNLHIKAGAGYSNEILVSDSGFSLGRKDMVNTSVPENTSHKISFIPKHTPMPKAAHKEVLSSPKHTSAITHKEEKSLWYLLLLVPSEYGMLFDDKREREREGGGGGEGGIQDEVIPSQTSDLRLLSRVRNRTKVILSDVEVGRLWASLGKCLEHRHRHARHTCPKSYQIL